MTGQWFELNMEIMSSEITFLSASFINSQTQKVDLSHSLRCVFTLLTNKTLNPFTPKLDLKTVMDSRNKKNGGWLSVPQFGDWDQKGQVPDYSLDFSKIRETRKHNKSNISRPSLGNEQDFHIDSTSTTHHHQHSPTVSLK
ncbi:unnamed protein product [Vicia faba]|uniref:RIN4 pathogenic type III effector avirulence factor Avr cleavage site domain-containing protein n=1 Tax=Vicia faba TaxID=3906 RepID=A0AAV1BC46_VICFA|nr:unnamed protein product [Vicia faba]